MASLGLDVFLVKAKMNSEVINLNLKVKNMTISPVRWSNVPCRLVNGYQVFHVRTISKSVQFLKLDLEFEDKRALTI